MIFYNAYFIIITLINWNCMKESDIEIPKIVRDKA